MPVNFSQRSRLNNFINKDFQNMLFPLDIVMSALQIPKYKCSDGFITPSGPGRKLKIIVMNIVLLVIVYIRFINSIVGHFIAPDNFIIFTLYVDVLYCSLGLSAICVGNITNTNNNVKIVLNLQKAFRMFRCTIAEKSLKRLTFWNWVSWAILTVGYVFCISLMLIAQVRMEASQIVPLLLNFLPFIFFDASVVCITRELWIIKDGLILCSKELKRGIANPGVQRVLDSYRLILEAFALFKKVSSVTIAFLLTDILAHAVMNLQVNMDSYKQEVDTSLSQFVSNPARISIILWTSKNYLLLCLFCYVLNSFYAHVREVEEICCAVLFTTGIPGTDTRQLCKNIRRYTNTRFRHLRVCGVRVDAQLPLQLAGVIATYLVVVLQLNL